jgi:hypothetical protein
VAQSAEERETDAMRLRRQAEDTNYHAQVSSAGQGASSSRLAGWLPGCLAGFLEVPSSSVPAHNLAPYANG